MHPEPPPVSNDEQGVPRSLREVVIGCGFAFEVRPSWGAVFVVDVAWFAADILSVNPSVMLLWLPMLTPLESAKMRGAYSVVCGVRAAGALLKWRLWLFC